jgi:hypothetical protein
MRLTDNFMSKNKAQTNLFGQVIVIFKEDLKVK